MCRPRPAAHEVPVQSYAAVVFDRRRRGSGRRSPVAVGAPLLLSREAVGKFLVKTALSSRRLAIRRERRAGGGGSLGGGAGDLMAVQLEEVVGGGDEPPFRAAGRSAAALESSDLAVELQPAEDRLDGGLAAAVERAAVWGRE